MLVACGWQSAYLWLVLFKVWFMGGRLRTMWGGGLGGAGLRMGLGVGPDMHTEPTCACGCERSTFAGAPCCNAQCSTAKRVNERQGMHCRCFVCHCCLFCLSCSVYLTRSV